MEVMVTGGAGYIGSHVVISLIESGNQVVVIDNFTNSSKNIFSRIKEITGHDVIYYECDINDTDSVHTVFAKHDISCVIHLAGLKSVSESISLPIDYYKINVSGSLAILSVMRSFGVKNFIFSSSATVYGDPEFLPIKESAPTQMPKNPYGQSKLMVENILSDLSSADQSMNIVVLRYFNPVGAHPSGLIGESPKGIPNNLMPYICQVAVKSREVVSVFGNDFETLDGTGVRDYLHVADLARGHVSARQFCDESPGYAVVNLGTGQGYSVLQMIDTFSKVNNVDVPYLFTARRDGDVAECFADVALAKSVLNWEANYDLDAMCRHAYRWQELNPRGLE